MVSEIRGPSKRRKRVRQEWLLLRCAVSQVTQWGSFPDTEKHRKCPTSCVTTRSRPWLPSA